MPTPASPGTNLYRCEMCGRKFNEETEFREHQQDCARAYQSGRPNKDKDQPKAGEAGANHKWVSKP